MSGTARGVLRSARPLSLSSEVLPPPPGSGGSSHGWAPTAMKRPAKTSATKYARCFHRLTAAPTECEHRQQVGDREEPEALCVLDARLDPRAEAVAAVEEPVAEAAQDLRGDGGGGDDRRGLGVLEDLDAVAALHRQARDPPQRGQQREHADAEEGGRGSRERRLLRAPTPRTGTTAGARRPRTRARSR